MAHGAMKGGKAGSMLEDLKAVRGSRLDRAYMDMMVQDHEKDVRETRAAAEQLKGSNEELASLLEDTAEKMEDHLEDAKEIRQDLTRRQAREPSSNR
jgi:putative membrane protein